MRREISPLSNLQAEVTVPGSKSFTQRALVIASLAEGESVLYQPLFSEDTYLLMEALSSLGVILQKDGDHLRVRGLGRGPLAPEKPIYLGNNGTGLRLLTTFCALGTGKFFLTGDSRLCERPIGPLIQAMQTIGVRVTCHGQLGTPPVEIFASGIKGGKVVLHEIESSQYVSALLIAAPCMPEGLELELQGRIPSYPYIEMTCEIMKAFGVQVESEAPSRYRIRPGHNYRATHYWVEGDASSASYFFLAAALTKGRVRVRNINIHSRQGDLRLLDIMEQMGVSVVRDDQGIEVIGRPLAKGDFTFPLGDIPDMVPTLAMLAAAREGTTTIVDVAHLRYKESDRLHALATELNKIGVKVKEIDDGLIISGGNIHGGEIETYQDHRLAMSFACLGLLIPGIVIKDSECVAKSFPDFWEKFGSLRTGQI
ncbi:MAG: 3-phosphoshikimate 1-carboxyvinyltransferase [Syntrophales bacterium]|nr:3-phosphoshikimate 1-carboxyvinyltransferase [Syntrophales bacterium]